MVFNMQMLSWFRASRKGLRKKYRGYFFVDIIKDYNDIYISFILNEYCNLENRFMEVV